MPEWWAVQVQIRRMPIARKVLAMTPTTVAPPPVSKSVASSLGINYPPLHSQAAERPSLPLGRLVGITVVKQANSRESRESEGCTRAGAAAGHFLRSSFWAEKRRSAPISRNFQRNSPEFLCASDYMAEREGFEPSIQVLARITV